MSPVRPQSTLTQITLFVHIITDIRYLVVQRAPDIRQLTMKRLAIISAMSQFVSVQFAYNKLI